MAKSIVIDSSIFISSLISGDTNHKISRKFLAAVKKKKRQVIIPMLAVFEILHAYFKLCKDIDKTDRLYQMLIDWNVDGTLRIINMEAEALVYFTAHHHLFPLKTADTIIAITAHHFKSTLISLDKQLLKNAKKHIRTITPMQFLHL